MQNKNICRIPNKTNNKINCQYFNRGRPVMEREAWSCLCLVKRDPTPPPWPFKADRNQASCHPFTFQCVSEAEDMFV